MKHVIGRLSGVVKYDGSINARLTEMDVREGSRPKTAEDFGADRDALAAINLREPGVGFETLARPGAGVALVVPDISVFHSSRDDKFLEKMARRWGGIGSGLIGPVRDFNAPGDFSRQDVCAGIVEEKDLMMAAFAEIVEMGFYKDDGWARFILPINLNEYQKRVDDELAMEWSRLAPGFPQKHEIRISPFLVARDRINDLPCLLSTEPENGSVEIIISAYVLLSGFGWKVRDTEHHNGQPLNRLVALACPRVEATQYSDGIPDFLIDSLQLFLGPDGFDRRALPIVLTREYSANYINEKTLNAMRFLGFLPPTR